MRKLGKAEKKRLAPAGGCGRRAPARGTSWGGKQYHKEVPEEKNSRISGQKRGPGTSHPRIIFSGPSDRGAVKEKKAKTRKAKRSASETAQPSNFKKALEPKAGKRNTKEWP